MFQVSDAFTKATFVYFDKESKMCSGIKMVIQLHRTFVRANFCQVWNVTTTVLYKNCNKNVHRNKRLNMFISTMTKLMDLISCYKMKNHQIHNLLQKHTAAALSHTYIFADKFKKQKNTWPADPRFHLN